MIKQRNIEREPSRFSQIWDESPISRDVLDILYAPARLAAGALFVGFCGLSTIFGVADDVFEPLVEHRQAIETMTSISVDTWTWIIGIAAAIIIFVWQIITGERHRKAYIISLVPDIWYSYAWTRVLVLALLPTAFEVATMPLAVFLAYIAAKYGEILIFGKRR